MMTHEQAVEALGRTKSIPVGDVQVTQDHFRRWYAKHASPGPVTHEDLARYVGTVAAQRRRGSLLSLTHYLSWEDGTPTAHYRVVVGDDDGYFAHEAPARYFDVTSAHVLWAEKTLENFSGLDMGR